MKIYMETMGCPKNQTDSEQARGLLVEHGHTMVCSPQEADAILVNTCGFIKDAKEESIERILDLAEYKKENEALLIVSGCLSQRYGKDFQKSMPEVDIMIGVNDYQNLPHLLASHRPSQRELSCSDSKSYYEEWGTRQSQDVSHYAYLKISEGCNNSCAYCIIPSIRGGFRSRAEENILKEAEALAKAGCKELILVAQDVTAYGMDLDGKYHLAELLKKLCRIPEIQWIRLLYCYEDRITDELIEVIAKEDKICKYLDIPLQHSADPVLRAMNRRSTNQSIRETIEKLRHRIPEIHIRTTLITGFPGETKADFEELYSFVKEMRFERLGVFSYSKEEGTTAALMKNQVAWNTKRYRHDQIMELQRAISNAKNQADIGWGAEVIIDEIQEDGTCIGRSRFDSPEIDFSILFPQGQQRFSPGDLVRVRIIDAFDYDLIGEYIETIS